MIPTNYNSRTYDFTFTATYAWADLIISYLSLIVMVYVYWLLIRMGFTMQALLREYKHVKGMTGEALIAISFLFFSGYLFYYQLLKPTISLLLIT